MRASQKLKKRIKGRLCWLCKYCTFDGGERGYSELTPGCEGSLSCGRGVYNHRMDELDTEKLRQTLQTAEICRLFEKRDISQVARSSPGRLPGRKENK